MLPTSRNTNYGAASPVKSADLDDMQDCIIGLKHGPITRHMLPPNPGVAQWTRTTSALYIHSTASGDCIIPIDTAEGDHITAFAMKLYGDASVDVDYEVLVVADDMISSTTLSTTTDTNRPAAWGTLTMPAFIAHTMAAGEVLFLYANATAANARIGRMSRTFARL